MNQSVEESLAFEVRDSGIHGRGAFATRPIRAGERVAEYVGERISKSESLRRQEEGNEYIFTLDEEVDIDGLVEWNPARFVNHSCDPNCETEIEDESIWVVALRDIAPGEELTYNYCYDFEEYREHPCRCGTKRCVGYMLAEELWEKLPERGKEQEQKAV